MISFLEDYHNGHPVAVFKDGKPFGIPCGFVLFPDGVAWADDAVLQDQPSTHPYHQLYGEVTFPGPDIVCQGYRFCPAPPWDPVIATAWNYDQSVVGEPVDWLPIHARHEHELRLGRLWTDLDRMRADRERQS